MILWHNPPSKRCKIICSSVRLLPCSCGLWTYQNKTKQNKLPNWCWKEQLRQNKVMIRDQDIPSLWYWLCHQILHCYISFTQDDEDAFVKRWFSWCFKAGIGKVSPCSAYSKCRLCKFSGNNIEIEGDSSQLIPAVHIVYRLNTPIGSTKLKDSLWVSQCVFQNIAMTKSIDDPRHAQWIAAVFGGDQIPCGQGISSSRAFFWRGGGSKKRDDRQEPIRAPWWTYRFITINPRYDLF